MMLKKYAHHAFYGAALISVAGMWLQWDWVKGTFDGWFPLAAVLMGQLTRIRNGLEPDAFDRAFKSRAIEKTFLASLVVFGLGIAGWYAYLVRIKIPRDRAESVEQFKKDFADYQKVKEAAK